MDRAQLQSAGTAYPYTHLQGLYGVPFGLAMLLVGLSNRTDPEPPRPLLVGVALLALGALAGVSLYYRHAFGRATAGRSRQTRHLTAGLIGFAVFVAADQLGRAVLGRPPRQSVSTTAAAWALGMLAFYVAAHLLRSHHVVIWGLVLVAGCLPIWGTGTDRDAVAYFPIAAALITAGVVDHLRLVGTFRSYRQLGLAGGPDNGVGDDGA